MGDSHLIIFPAEREHVPAPERIGNAAGYLSRLGAHEGVHAVTSAWPELIFPIKHFAGVECPICPSAPVESCAVRGVISETDLWWWEAVDRFEEEGTFTVAMPCCGREFALDGLRYGYAPGFARFRIEVFFPEWPCLSGDGDGRPALPDDVLAAVRALLGCEVRYLWQRM